MKSMKLALTTLALLIGQTTLASNIQSITLKTDVTLDKATDGYSGYVNLCIDVKTGKQTTDDNCFLKNDRRTCEVSIYNFETLAHSPMFIAKGTTFYVTEQMGPDISKDWNKKTSSFKLFANLNGFEGHTNPNMVIDCMETKSGLFAPKKFSKSEVINVFKSVLDIK